jgi:hypothetical protein
MEAINDYETILALIAFVYSEQVKLLATKHTEKLHPL